MLRPHTRPDGIEPLQPAKKQRVLCARHGAGHALIQVMMRVHEARRDDAALRLDNLALRPKALPDLGNHPVAQQQVCTCKLPPGIVHRDKVIRAADEGLCHRSHFSLCPSHAKCVWPMENERENRPLGHLSHPAGAGQSACFDNWINM